MSKPESSLPVALVVVDMQAKFLKAIPDAERVVRRCTLAVKLAELLRMPVCFTEQVPDKLGATEPALLEVSPFSPVFAKTSFAVWGAQGLPDFLKKLGARHLLIAGIETPICIYQSTTGAIQRDFEVTVLTDCVGARNADDATAALGELARAGAHLLPVETVAYAILNDASDPRFRDFTELIKDYARPAS